MIKKKRKIAALNLIQYCIELRPKNTIEEIPSSIRLRGIYALFKKTKKKGKDYYDVVYIGISTRNIKRRLITHSNDQNKENWTHFSVYKVWPNISDEVIDELEGLFLHIYSKDSKAQRYNKMKSKGLLRRVKIRNLKKQAKILSGLENALRFFPSYSKLNEIFRQ